MPSRFVISGPGRQSLKEEIDREIGASRPPAVALAVAYVSIYGAQYVRELKDRIGIEQVALVADIGDAISHPAALSLALDEGWHVRAVNADGTFHPKMIVFGDSVSVDGRVMGAKLSLVGSANLSKGGLQLNTECTFIRSSADELTGAATAFRSLWRLGREFDREQLRDYEKVFARRNRNRAARDLEILGVADEAPIGEAFAESTAPAVVRHKPAPAPSERSITTGAAAAAWTGLESFTGEYTLQVEFPRDAGEVLRRIFAAHRAGQDVELLCTDGMVRPMHFQFYEDNAMFRLNVPNETPNAAWARASRTGLALVEESMDGTLLFRIVRPGRDAMDIIGRSMALGTWGKTPTRLYGWY